MSKSAIRLAFLAILSALVASAPSMQQVRSKPPRTGGVNIINNLDSTVYVRSVFLDDGSVQTLPSNGGEYSEVWRPSHNGVGVSIKISTQTYGDDVLQFEYSAKNQTVWWDVSCINLSHNSRFFRDGFAAIPASHSCSPVVCWPGGNFCSDVYFKPDDNYAVRGCEVNTWVTLNIGIRNDVGDGT